MIFLLYWMLVILILAFIWVTPMAMIFVGALQMKKNPLKAKRMIIIAGIWLLVAVGFCELIMP